VSQLELKLFPNPFRIKTKMQMKLVSIITALVVMASGATAIATDACT
jgi:hypothetical protein